jgi:hypothetical protein
MSFWTRAESDSLAWGLGLSFLLHLLFVLVTEIELLGNLDLAPEPKVMEVELAPELPKPKPPPPAPPPPQPKVAEPPPPPPAPPRPEPQRPLAAPQRFIAAPQLQPAPLAEVSKAPEKPEPPHGISLKMSRDKGDKPPKPKGNLSQSAQDFILSQILAMWHFDIASARGRGFSIEIDIEVGPDGTLVGYLSKNAPWAPEKVITGYDRMPDNYARRALESMMLAIKMAQPLKLPPDDGKGWPKSMVMEFRLDDL